MKSTTLYHRLICIDALLSFDGIIPSLPELQLMLIALIERFSKALIAEGECEQLSDELCHALCCYLDRRVALRLRADNIAWDRYALTHYFYGYTDGPMTLGDRLEPLLADGQGQIFTYARKLFLVSAFTGRNSAPLLSLSVTQPAAACQTETEEAAPDTLPTRSPPRFHLPLQLILLSLLLIVLWLFCSAWLEVL